MDTPTRWPARLTLAAALLVLDVSLTFRNVWPTPAVRWAGDLSVELAAVLLALVLFHRRGAQLSRRALRALGILWTVLVVGHYAEVMAPALYGREVNLYWDLQHVSGVAAMLGKAASSWLVLGVLGAVVLVLGLLYTIVRWALGRVDAALNDPATRRIIAGLAAVVAVFWVVFGYGASQEAEDKPWFTLPVTQAWGHQVRLVVDARRSDANTKLLAASPLMRSDFSRIKGADVLLLFIESYGIVTYDRPEFLAGLAPARARFEAAVHETGREVVSAFVDSPTFGGSSWLAHITLMSGIDVRDPDTNALLMTRKRDTVVTAFKRHGYRTAALMPGLWHNWPEGVFYGFDDIFGGSRLDYKGPEFGWWSIPDQYTLARMHTQELEPGSRAPVFVFFPLITSHIPFCPIAPYQPDWSRMLTPDPFAPADVENALKQEPDWLNLGPDYTKAVAYDLNALTGFLRLPTNRDFVMVVLGDHQPPAAVSGQKAPWSVPVHIVASRAEVLDRLRARGFVTGLTPKRPSLGSMHTLLPLLLEAFGDPEPDAVAARP